MIDEHNRSTAFQNFERKQQSQSLANQIYRAQFRLPFSKTKEAALVIYTTSLNTRCYSTNITLPSRNQGNPQVMHKLSRN